MNLPTGAVTFLFTNIEGSARLAQAHPDRWDAMQERHHAILRHAIEAPHGYVFRAIGDAFCAAFHAAADALRAALKSQRDLRTDDWTGPQIKGRMGIHSLKNLESPERLWQVLAPGVSKKFPSVQTLSRPRGNLLMQLTIFIGRETEIAAIQRALENHHLVTLTGPGVLPDLAEPVHPFGKRRPGGDAPGCGGRSSTLTPGRKPLESDACLAQPGQIAVTQGEGTQARAYLEEGPTLFSERRDEYHANLARTEFAHVERWHGNYREASGLYRESIQVWDDLGLRVGILPELESLASIAAAQGRHAEAVRLFGAAGKLQEQTGDQKAPNESSHSAGAFAMLQTSLEQQIFDAGLEEGRAMSVSQAVAYALESADREGQ